MASNLERAVGEWCDPSARRISQDGRSHNVMGDWVARTGKNASESWASREDGR